MSLSVLKLQHKADPGAGSLSPRSAFRTFLSAHSSPTAQEPLLEEYSIASQIYRMSPADMCELARNSVVQSGFEMEVKRSVCAALPSSRFTYSSYRHWLGQTWYMPGVAGNSISQTNVPDVRMRFRNNTLKEERAMVCPFRHALRKG